MERRQRGTGRRSYPALGRDRRQPGGRHFDRAHRGPQHRLNAARAEEAGKRRPWRRFWRQLLVGAAAFLLVFGAVHLPFGLGTRVQAGLHYVLNAPYDLGLGRALAAGGALEGWRAWAKKVGSGWWSPPAATPASSSGTSGSSGSTGAATPGTQGGAAPGATPVAQGDLAWPAEGTVTCAFGWVSDDATGTYTLHEGLDIAAATGTPVLAALGGVVKSVRRDSDYGWLVELDHGAGLTTVYAHNESVLVREGETVRGGQELASMGATGLASGSHVHFEVRCDGAAVDPLPWLRSRGTGA
jgi:murein DD-endopeptidase MepM/ murein hydrolase activator NlpD